MASVSLEVTRFVVSMSSPMSTPAGDRGGWHVHKIRTWSGSPITISIPSFMHACNRPSEFCMHNDAIYPTAMQEDDDNSSEVDHIDSGKEPEPPKFIEPIQTATVTQGDMARFECVVTGRPMPEITWFHGEKMIKPSDLIEIGQDTEGRNWVVVRNATPKILGTFTCWAENQVGRTMCGAELTLMSEPEESSIVSVDSSAIVEGPQSRDLVSIEFEGVDDLDEEGVPPSFVMPVQDVEVKPGETAHLRVKVAGKPTPEVTWYRDGKVLQPSPRHTIMSDTEGNASLVISETMPGDDADYLCKAVNPFGIVSCRADVIVDEEPSEVKKEKPAILVQAEAQPQGPVEVTLEVRGKDLEIASISEAPSITSEEAFETDVEEKELDEAEAGEPEGWFQDDVQIEIQLEDLGKHPEEVIMEVTKKMEEKSVRQEAVMQVEVTPTREEVTLAPTEVPEQKAPVFTQPLKTAELKPGETTEITCKVEGHPRPEVQWFVDDKAIEPDTHYQTEHRPDGVCVLTIHDVESMDEGQYVVRAINPVGVASTESELFVEVPGKMAPVKVEAKATTEVEKPLETISKQEAAVVEEQVVPIEKKPTEAAPEVMPQFQLEPTQRETAEVYEAPKFVEDMVDLEIIKGHPARFDVQVSGIPMPILHWYRNGKEIKPDDQHVKFEFAEDEGIGSLIIDEVRANDDAEYACKASNKAGSAVSKADLFLQAAHKKRPEKHPPKFIIDMKSLTAVEGDSINFFCKVVGRPMPEIKWYKNGVELKLGPRISIDYDEQGMCTLLIRNTTMEDVATFTCKAVNEIGEATTTAELILEVPARITDGPKNVSVKRGDSVTVDIHIVGFPQPAVTWYKNSVVVETTERITTETTRETSQLVISKAQMEDAGNYVVVVENELARDELQISITVIDIPDKPRKLEPTQVTPTSTTITWQTPVMEEEGQEVSSYVVEMLDSATKSWQRIAETLKAPVFTIADLTPGEEYAFRVSASNQFGVGEPTEKVSVHLPMEKELEAEPKEVAEDTLTLQTKTMIPEGMASLAHMLEWDIVAFLVIFIAMCYVVLFI